MLDTALHGTIVLAAMSKLRVLPGGYRSCCLLTDWIWSGVRLMDGLSDKRTIMVSY